MSKKNSKSGLKIETRIYLFYLVVVIQWISYEETENKIAPEENR